MKVLQLTSMALSPEEKSDCVPMASSQPNYPYGLSISLCDKELEKLGIDYDDVETDNVVHLHALGVVTAKSSNTVQGTDPTYRIEIQLTHLAAVEDEDTENKEVEKQMSVSKKLTKFYK